MKIDFSGIIKDERVLLKAFEKGGKT